MGETAREKQVYVLGRRWRKARDSRRWLEADGLARQILLLLPQGHYDVGTYRTYLCDSLLYRGELDKARVSYLKLVPKGELQETAAYAGLARIAAERRDFTPGNQWLERYAKAPGSGCGTCIGRRRYQTHVLQTVWKAAMQPASEAPLRELIAGNGYTPLEMGSKVPKPAYQKESAAQEARLILAEQLVRQKRIPEAKVLFRELMAKVSEEYRAEDELFILAEAHLKKLG